MKTQIIKVSELQPGMRRFTVSPDSVTIDGCYADCSHPSVFVVVNRRSVLMTHRPRRVVFEALKACSKGDIDATTATLAAFGVSAYPNVPTRDDLAWFDAHRSSEAWKVLKSTYAGRIWRAVKNGEGLIDVVSFWLPVGEVPGSVLNLVMEASGVPAGRPVCVRWMDSVGPILFSTLPVRIKCSAAL